MDRRLRTTTLVTTSRALHQTIGLVEAAGASVQGNEVPVP
jgi:hypothetical protein